MEHLPENHIKHFDYYLPQDRIAFFPLPERDSSQLLIRDPAGTIGKDIFRNLNKYIPENSLLIFNDSKVIPARLIFPSEKGSMIEIFCLEPADPQSYRDIMQKKGNCKWKCLIGNKKQLGKIKPRQLMTKTGNRIMLEVIRVENHGLTNIVEFAWNDAEMTFGSLIAEAGLVPLPPYIKREPVQSDIERYQTVYSNTQGSVAAPTAGLHFTPRILDELRELNVRSLNITLHVGAGTFLPVKTEKITDHSMHSEFFSVTRQFINDLIVNEGPVIPIGTTSLRTLESLYRIGAKIVDPTRISDNLFQLNQWEAYELSNAPSCKNAFTNLLKYSERNGLQEISGKTSLMIMPGYKFRVADAIITNFHQPKSTLLFLIAAFIGDAWKDVYTYAMENDFRFLSYGDSSLLWKTEY